MFELKINKLPQDISNLMIPFDLNKDIIIDINNKYNQELLKLFDKKIEKFQSFFKKYYSIKKELIKIKKSQEEENKENCDLKILEKEFIELEKMSEKLFDDLIPLNDALLQLLIKNFTPEVKENNNEK